jgi:hypothetical protein
MRISGFIGAVILGAVIASAMSSHRADTAAAPANPTQDTMYLDRRISALEQRFNLLESSVRNMEQQALLSRRSSAQAQRDQEVGLIRSELEVLKGRMRIVECGLIHLDERTLSPSARAGLSPQQSKDPCRLRPETPLQLPPQ